MRSHKKLQASYLYASFLCLLEPWFWRNQGAMWKGILKVNVRGRYFLESFLVAKEFPTQIGRRSFSQSSNSSAVAQRRTSFSFTPNDVNHLRLIHLCTTRNILEETRREKSEGNSRKVFFHHCVSCLFPSQCKDKVTHRPSRQRLVHLSCSRGCEHKMCRSNILYFFSFNVLVSEAPVSSPVLCPTQKQSKRLRHNIAITASPDLTYIASVTRPSNCQPGEGLVQYASSQPQAHVLLSQTQPKVHPSLKQRVPTP